MTSNLHAQEKINWLNLIVLCGIASSGIVGTSILLLLGKIKLMTLLLTLILMNFSGLSISAGYHRLFSHKSYEAVWPVRLFFLLFGAALFEGSVLEWASDHRRHHRYLDTEQDPYNINRGFWYAHIGWLFLLDPKARHFSNAKDLTKDRLVMWQHDNYTSIAIFMGLILPCGIASLWGDPLGGLIIAGLLQITINQHMTFCVNSVCHKFGKRPYALNSARNNSLMAFFTCGGGFHNFHHAFPFDYRDGVKFYHYDPSKWLINILLWLGLAKNLRKAKYKQLR